MSAALTEEASAATSSIASERSRYPIGPRWCKNFKNSIPSRGRRFIISGLRTIFEAIVGARKYKR